MKTSFIVIYKYLSVLNPGLKIIHALNKVEKNVDFFASEATLICAS